MRSLAFLSLLILVFCQDPFLGESQKSGLVDLTNGDDMFYWLFNSRRSPSTDPLVMWLTGGPGCASETALFFENGPFSINDDLTLKNNPYSWNDVANVVYVDQPVGTGFSKCNGLDHHDTDEDQVAKDMAEFLNGFLSQNPEFNTRDFYIVGESYAGHYIPAISYYIINNMTDFKMTFKGMAIGNGWVDPYIQYPEYATFAYENNLIGKVQYESLQVGFAGCQKLINSRYDTLAMDVCSLLSATILGKSTDPNFNPYDIRIACEDPPLCYNFTNSETYLNQDDIQEQLGVQGRKWESCNKEVQIYLMGDWMTNLADKVANIADKGYNILVYSGDKDYICNWRGGEAWTKTVEWSGKEQFNQASYQDWSVEGTPAGQLKYYENFRFLRVYNAGHMVPMDQPKVALEMMKAFLTDEISLEVK